jgi:ribosomal peptide maturation radical SAM protein 1
LRKDLDALPLPDHAPYFAQHAQSEWHDLKPIVFFETSRGCWWGQKHLCTFCGLSERELAFRSKSPARLYSEIQSLYKEHPGAAYLHPTDDILDTRYFETLLPALARMPREPERPLRLFFEVKSNMRPEHLHLLRLAGVDGVQPGIESFSDEILALMDKGTTGLQQVQFIKWAASAGIRVVYNILFRNPGESPAAYHEMAALIPHLQHLPPPSSVVLTELERFSPYFKYRDRFAITNVRPKAYHQLVFPMPGVDLDGIAYRFDYDHPCKHDPELQKAQQECVVLLKRWRKSYRPGTLFYLDRGDHLVINDARGDSPRLEILAGPAAQLFAYLDRHRAFTAIAQRFAALDETVLRARLSTWSQQGFIYSAANDEHVALVPRLWETAPTLEAVLAQLPATRQRAPGLLALRLPTATLSSNGVL